MIRPPAQTQIEIEGETLVVPQYLHSLAYLARVFKVGETSPVEKMLTTSVEEAYDWLNSNIGETQYGDIQVYDVTWVGEREPILLRTLPSRRRQH